MPAHSQLSHDVRTWIIRIIYYWESGNSVFGRVRELNFKGKKKLSVKSSKKGEIDEHSRLQESIILIKLQRKELTSRDE